MAADFYQQLFTAQKDLQPELICQLVPRKVTVQMQEMLERAFSAEEVEKALFQMARAKRPEQMVSQRDFFRSTGYW
jgi:hypothetical protein